MRIRTEHDYLTFLRSFLPDDSTLIYQSRINYRDGYFEACNGQLACRLPERYLPAQEQLTEEKFPQLDAVVQTHAAVEKLDCNIMNFLPAPEQLKRLTPPADVGMRCDDCRGRGTLRCDLGHSHECEECDGRGYVPSGAEVDFVKVLGSVFQWRYFRKVINAAEIFGHEFSYSNVNAKTHLFTFGDVQIVTTPVTTPGVMPVIELGEGSDYPAKQLED
jgi:hypothetical protein